MRRIGLLGGMSSEGTALYYERINALVRSRLGGLSSGDILLHSHNFRSLMTQRRAGAFELVASTLADSAEWLVRAGAEIVLICADPMHMVSSTVAARMGQVDLGARLIHAVDETALAIQAQGCCRPLLLAMQNAMEQDAYGKRMEHNGISVRFPGRQDCEMVKHIILDELCSGQVRHKSRDRLLDVIKRGADAGADSVIFACPEIAVLLDPCDLVCPGFDSASIHAEAAVECALEILCASKVAPTSWLPSGSRGRTEPGSRGE